MMTVSVHVNEKTKARVEVLEASSGPFIALFADIDGGEMRMFLPASRIDDARRIARALNNE